MHTVFLSEPPLIREENPEAERDLTEVEQAQEEIGLLAKFQNQHGRVNFDRLPTCPLCLERLDASFTGLNQAICEMSGFKPSEGMD